MRIEDLIFAAGHGGFYTDDQAAIRAGAVRDGFMYLGEPSSPALTEIRNPSAVLSIGLVLSDSAVCWGDCITVQYAAVAGRDAPHTTAELEVLLRRYASKNVIGLELAGFRRAVDEVLPDSRVVGEQIPQSARYGLSQALLVATAHARRTTIAELVRTEYGFPVIDQAVPLFSQCGEDRFNNVDKIILRRADALSHGLINTPELVGKDGSTFRDYVNWVCHRVRRFAGRDYAPVLHFDVYGGLGTAFEGDVERIAQFLRQLSQEIAPLKLRIESPIDFGERTAQIRGLKALRQYLGRRSSGVEIVADEWCNTIADVEAFVEADAADLIQIKMPDGGSLDDVIRAIQTCREGKVGVYLGGSCTETDLSSRISVHIAVAAQVDVLLAKPGMGVDEAYSITANEQSRLLATLRRSRGAAFDNAVEARFAK